MHSYTNMYTSKHAGKVTHTLHTFACIYVCMYACVYVCTYVCMHACMYVCMHAHTHTHTQVYFLILPIMHIVFSQTMAWDKDSTLCRTMQENEMGSCTCSQKYPVRALSCQCVCLRRIPLLCTHSRTHDGAFAIMTVQDRIQHSRAQEIMIV
jgi:hypothetical protein